MRIIKKYLSKFKTLLLVPFLATPPEKEVKNGELRLKN
jgi:hypothetical protein